MAELSDEPPQHEPEAGLRAERRDRMRQQVRRGAYILPSLFTMGNIWLGFYAVVLAYRGASLDRFSAFEVAAWMVIFAGILDGLDGRIARLTNTESEFGKEFDSLADVLTFGAAPALISFLWGLSALGRLGWLVPLYFLLCTTVRLARFNVQTKSVDSRYFVGLPSPAAAGSIMVFLLFDQQFLVYELWQQIREPVLLGILVGAGSLMISTFRYPSFKTIDLRRRWSYRSAMVLAVILLVLTFRPALFFQIFISVYTLYGPTMWLIGRLTRRTEAAPDPATAPSTQP